MIGAHVASDCSPSPPASDSLFLLLARSGARRLAILARAAGAASAVRSLLGGSSAHSSRCVGYRERPGLERSMAASADMTLEPAASVRAGLRTLAGRATSQGAKMAPQPLRSPRAGVRRAR